MSHSPFPPLAAQLTPPGTGAIATIAVRGASARDLLGEYFTPRAAAGWNSVTQGRLLLGDWKRRDGSREELVLACIEEDHWEIHCHGGVAAVETLLSDLRSRGAKVVPWSTWLEQEVPDPIPREALVQLACAATPRTAAILLDQYRGALGSALQAIRRKIGEGATDEALADLQQLLERRPIGAHLKEPWRVTLLGPPNVGKSSLLNRILGYARAIVYDQPGTTRDVVSAPAALDGWPIELSDTAGLRISEDSVEQAGVELARREAQRADLFLYLADAGATAVSLPVEPLPDDLDLQSPRCLRVFSKWDLQPPGETPPPGWFPVSARTGEGVEELLAEVCRRLVPDPPPPGAPVPFHSRHWDHLDMCRQALMAGDGQQAGLELQRLLGEDTAG